MTQLPGTVVAPKEVEHMSDLGQLRRATGWLSQHGLAETGPTPLLTARLVVRRRARVELFAMAAVVFVLAGIAQFLVWYRQESGSLDPRMSFGLVGLGFLVVLFAVIADAHLSTPVLAVNARPQ
jgi:hypothetical membrane protein